MSATRFIKDVFLVGTADAIRSVRGLLVLPLLARLLGAEEYGLWVQLQVTVVLLGCVVRIGLKESIVRFLGGEQEPGRLQRGFNTAVCAVAALAVVMAAGIFACAGHVAALVAQDAGHAWLVRLIAPMIVLEAVDQVALSFLQSSRRMGVRAVLLVAELVAEVALIGGLAAAGRSLAVILGWLVGWRGLFVLVKLGYIWSRIGIAAPAPDLLRSYVRFGWPLMLANLCYLAMNYSDRYVVTHMVGLSGVGLYAVAYTVANLLVILLTPIDYVLYPTITAFWNQGKLEDVKIHIRYAIKYVLLIGLPALLMVTCYAEPIITLVSSSEFAAASACVPIIGAGLLLLLLGLVGERIVLLAKGSRWLMALYASLAAVNVLLNWCLVPTAGILGAAMATFLTFGLYAVGTLTIARRYCPVTFEALLFGKVVLAGLAMAMVMRGFYPLSLAGAAGELAAGGLAYLAVLVLVKGFDARERNMFLALAAGTWMKGRAVEQAPAPAVMPRALLKSGL